MALEEGNSEAADTIRPLPEGHRSRPLPGPRGGHWGGRLTRSRRHGMKGGALRKALCVLGRGCGERVTDGRGQPLGQASGSFRPQLCRLGPTDAQRRGRRGPAGVTWR